jgi:hypothetical protein
MPKTQRPVRVEAELLSGAGTRWSWGTELTCDDWKALEMSPSKTQRASSAL